LVDACITQVINSSESVGLQSGCLQHAYYLKFSNVGVCSLFLDSQLRIPNIPANIDSKKAYDDDELRILMKSHYFIQIKQGDLFPKRRQLVPRKKRSQRSQLFRE